MRAVVYCFGCLLLLLPNARAAENPNVLFIAVDDLNTWVGCMKTHPGAKTPNIDRLAARGTLFTNAHCQAPICGPSRASLMTGLLPSTTGIYGQIPDRDIRKASEITANVTFLPDYFEQHGYRTLACGKLFHNGDKAKVFDDYGGHSSFGPKPETRFKYDPAWFPEKIGSTQTDWGAFPERDEEMPDFKIAEYGVEQLNRKHDKPFFLAVGFMRPHVPWYCPQKWFDLHPIDQVKLPPYLKNDFDDIPEMSRRVNELPAMPTTEWAIQENEWKNIVQAYLACTTFVDAQIGKVLDALEQSEYAENTIVVFWSDHGYHIGEKNRFAKQALWNPATRVPLIIATPEHKQARTSEVAVGLIDLYPTLLDLCGLPPYELNEGKTLVPLLDGQAEPRTAITSYGQHNHAVQSGWLRYYHYEDGSVELYHHAKDPNEWENLAQAEPGVIMHNRFHLQQLPGLLPQDSAKPSPLNKYPTNEYFLEQQKLLGKE